MKRRTEDQIFKYVIGTGVVLDLALMVWWVVFYDLAMAIVGGIWFGTMYGFFTVFLLGTIDLIDRRMSKRTKP